MYDEFLLNLIYIFQQNNSNLKCIQAGFAESGMLAFIIILRKMIEI